MTVKNGIQQGIKERRSFFILSPVKRAVLILAILLAISSFGQEAIKRRIVSEEGIPIPFAGIRFLPGSSGTTANEDGFFIISGNLLDELDAIEVSGLGYHGETVSIKRLEKFPIITLQSNIVSLGEVVITPKDEKEPATMLFEAFKRRSSIFAPTELSATLRLRSTLNGNPIEHFEGRGFFKTNSAGTPAVWTLTEANILASSDREVMFYSINTTGILESFTPFEPTGYYEWPLHPALLGKKDLYKDYKINISAAAEYSDEKVLLYDLISEENHLSARVWIRDSDSAILRYELYGDQITQHPFSSIVSGVNVSNVSMVLSYEFEPVTERLKLITWDYDFDYGEMGHIQTSVKVFVTGSVPEEAPLFIRPADYHDYVMAVILPPSNTKKTSIPEIAPSQKDLLALEYLQAHGDELRVGITFWNKNNPLRLQNIPHDPEMRKRAYAGLPDPNRITTPSEFFKPAFNTVLSKRGGEFVQRTFIDTMTSSISLPISPETELLLNLSFDEYGFAGERLETASGISDARRLLKLERKELDLRLNRLLTDSKGGSDLSFLLEKNHGNYKLYGIDRFFQLHESRFDVLQAGEYKHIDPENPEDMILANLVLERYQQALKIADKIENPSAKVSYYKALCHYHIGNCEQFKIEISKSMDAGFKPESGDFSRCP